MRNANFRNSIIIFIAYQKPFLPLKYFSIETKQSKHGQCNEELLNGRVQMQNKIVYKQATFLYLLLSNPTTECNKLSLYLTYISVTKVFLVILHSLIAISIERDINKCIGDNHFSTKDWQALYFAQVAEFQFQLFTQNKYSMPLKSLSVLEKLQPNELHWSHWPAGAIGLQRNHAELYQIWTLPFFFFFPKMFLHTAVILTLCSFCHVLTVGC